MITDADDDRADSVYPLGGERCWHRQIGEGLTSSWLSLVGCNEYMNLIVSHKSLASWVPHKLLLWGIRHDNVCFLVPTLLSC